MTSSLLLLTLLASGACVPVEGDRIHAGDLAKAEPAFRALPRETPLGYAPAPGARRVFHPAELRRLANRHGITVEKAREVCFEVPVKPLRQEQVLGAMRVSLGRADARIEILEFSSYPAPKGDIEFPLAGLARPPAIEPMAAVVWRGSIRYGGKRSFRIWARVRIVVTGQRVVAVETLPAGRPIDARHVRLESYAGFPAQQEPLAAIDQVVGRKPRRTLAAGTPLLKDLLLKPEVVARGDAVLVEVRSGAARIRFEGRAESGGGLGETIAVRNTASGRSFQAKVEGKGLVAVGSGLKEELR
jgi:flagella basal body P-ring formation protein FlgA